MVLYIASANKADVKTTVYSGGEIQTEILFPSIPGEIEVVARIESSDDLVELMMAHEILDRRYPNSNKFLTIPYLPYARQDRITQPHRAFSLKVFAKLINDMKFDIVTSYDVHSDVAGALIDRFAEVTQQNIVMAFRELSEFVLTGNISAIVSPDAGAYKKASAIANHYNRPLITAVKVRDTYTNELSGVDVLQDVRDHNLLIVDDICDGGRTFIELAKLLRARGAKSVHLYVTHGIFSRGTSCFRGLIDRIFTTNTFNCKINDVDLTVREVV